ncbi:hypothetical protein HS125_07060 [bacterium]|nr:hypothetical protein [bacterium]
MYVGTGSMSIRCLTSRPTENGRADEVLHGYRGYLQADAYTGYDELYRAGDR